ncbi:hypothetical protein [Brevundimonas sp. UBA7664]|uniref:hypothetical protein n=1 Tax=Brevundimonas sp. UBA7664 TaxID=1946141 RepID=UPI0025C1037C|nr:hypothetical protein [Brevundimonas sp. UBA7664]
MAFEINAPLRTAAILFSAGVLVAGCDRPAEPAAAPEVPAAPAPPSPTLDRGSILAAIDAAASDAAAGVARPGPDPLVGRTFSLRLAFGCFGPQAPTPGESADRDGTPRWSAPDDGRTIRLTLSPADWSAGDVSGPAPDGFDTLSGVWINQPWMRSEACPAWSVQEAEAPEAPRPARVAALVMVRPSGASRVGRSGDQTFTHVVRTQGEAPVARPALGYRLVLEGRLAGWADGRVIRCRVVTPERPPACAVGATVDRVAFEDGATGAILSEWRPG